MFQFHEPSPSFVKIPFLDGFISIHHYYSFSEYTQATICLEVIFDQLLLHNQLPTETRKKIEAFSFVDAIESILWMFVERRRLYFESYRHRFTKYEIFLDNVPQHCGNSLYTHAVEYLVNQVADIAELETSEIQRLYISHIATLKSQFPPHSPLS